MNEEERLVMELLEKAKNIFCPYCYHKQDLDTLYKIATMWGDKEDKDHTCEECGKEFRVNEEVTRIFRSFPIPNPDDTLRDDQIRDLY